MSTDTQIQSRPEDLLAAAGKSDLGVERRSGRGRRVAHDRRNRTKQTVGLEISPSGIELAIIYESSDGNTRRLVTDHFPFDHDSGPTNGNWHTPEISEAIKTLVDRHKLSGQKTVVGISGDLCVTRALFGENDDVQLGMAELAERSNRYLALGRDEKLCCFSEKAIDARRKRAWMTVSKRSVVAAISDAAASAGLRLVRMEHALVALCRAFGNAGLDADAPILIIADSPDGLSLNISHRGQLLLDYRPATSGGFTACEVNAWADTIKQHIKCLRRYLQSQISRDAKPLSMIYIVGRKSVDPTVVDDLRQHCGLDVRVLPVTEFTHELECDRQPSNCSEMLTAIWMASDESKSHDHESPTDILTTLHPGERVAILPLIRAIWPLALAAGLVVALFGVARIEHSQSVSMEKQIESLQSERIEAGRIRLVLDRREHLHTEADRLGERIPKPAWNFMLRQAGELMPQGVWLESLMIDRGPITIVGVSFTDDAIYEYISRLKGSSAFSRVSLTSTQSIGMPSGPAFRFEISAESGVTSRDHPVQSAVAYNDRADASESSHANSGEDQNG